MKPVSNTIIEIINTFYIKEGTIFSGYLYSYAQAEDPRRRFKRITNGVVCLSNNFPIWTNRTRKHQFPSIYDYMEEGYEAC